MTRKRYEVELFYELNENVSGTVEDAMQLRGNLDDLYDMIENCSNLVFGKFKWVESDYDATIGRTMRQVYLLESKIIPNFSIECEFAVKLSMLDEAAYSRLEEMGYDRAKRIHYFERLRWNFCCCVHEDTLYYRTDDMIFSFDDSVKTLVQQLRIEEVLCYIHDDGYRKWLHDTTEWRIYYENIVFGAPLDIRTKITMMDDITEVPHNNTGKTYHDCHVTNPSICDFTGLYRKALQMTEIDSPVSAYVLHEKTRTETNGKETVYDRVLTYRTFPEVLRAITEKYHGEEPNEFDCRWNYVERFDLSDGEYQKVAFYLISEKGVIWHASVLNIPLESKEKELCLLQHNPISGVDLPVPYQCGDIIAIDCRPFHSPYHALVIYESEGEYNYSPECLRLLNGTWDLTWLDSFHRTVQDISPFYRMGLYEEELPENEMLLGELSKLLKAGPDLTERIHQILAQFEGQAADDALWDLVREHQEADS